MKVKCCNQSRSGQIIAWVWLYSRPLAAFLILLTAIHLNASDLQIRSAARPELATAARVVQLLGVSSSSSSRSDCTRVIIDLSEDAQYKVWHLSAPERVYIDFSHTVISPRV